MKLAQPAPVVMTTEEAAALLGVTRTTVTRWIEAGELPAIRVGERGRWRVLRASVEALVRAEPVQSRYHVREGEPLPSSAKEDLP